MITAVNNLKLLTRFSANKFTCEDDIYFDPEKYSRFKFGCKDSARKFGTELAKKFVNSEHYQDMCTTLRAKNNRIVVMSSPYVHVPTATFAMKDYFVRYLNAVLVEDGLMPVMETKIYRKSSYKEEYGEMSKEERYKVMSADTFYVDANLLKDNIRMFLDDIVITGAHEHRILSMLEKYNLHESDDNLFLYFAELISHETNPVIENYLNYYYVTDLIKLDKIIKNEPFIMNTRVVKYILDADHEQCKTFLCYQKYVFIHTLYHNAIGNSYHTIPDYAKNLNYIKTLLNKNK